VLRPDGPGAAHCFSPRDYEGRVNRALGETRDIADASLTLRDAPHPRIVSHGYEVSPCSGRNHARALWVPGAFQSGSQRDSSSEPRELELMAFPGAASWWTSRQTFRGSLKTPAVIPCLRSLPVVSYKPGSPEATRSNRSRRVSVSVDGNLLALGRDFRNAVN